MPPGVAIEEPLEPPARGTSPTASSRSHRSAGRGPARAHRLGAGARRRLPALEVRRASLEEVPEADRRGGPMSGAALVFSPVPLRPEDVLARSGVGLLHRAAAAHLPVHLRDDLRQRDDRGARWIKTSTYYVPAIITLAVVSATMVSPAISLTQDRENGAEGCVNAASAGSTAGRVGNAVVISLLMALVLTLIGRVVYDVAIPDTTFPPRCSRSWSGRRPSTASESRSRSRSRPRTRRPRSRTRSRCRSTSSPGSSSPRPRSRTACSKSPTFPVPPLLRGVVRRVRSGDHGKVGPSSGTSLSWRCGGSPRS